MPDGEIVPLPADDRGLTVFPEIGQEQHWVKELFLLEIEELCELLMSKEQSAECGRTCQIRCRIW